jgi:hypothetical protein
MVSTSHSSRRWLALSTLILILAFAVRVHTLEYAHIWFDEAYSVMLARLPIVAMSMATGYDMHPPLYFILLRFWSFAAGQTEFAWRYPGVLISMTAVAAIGFLARNTTRRIGRPEVGQFVSLASMALIALSVLHIGWSKEIKMYSLVSLITIAGLWLTLRVLRRSAGSWKDVLALGVINGLGLLTWYGYLQVIVALNVACGLAFFFQPERGRLARRWIAAQAITVLLYLPWMFVDVVLTPRVWPDNPPIDYPPLHLILFYFGSMFAGISTNLGSYPPLLIVIMLGVAISLAFAWFQAASDRRMAWMVFFVNFVISIALLLLIYATRLKLQVPPPTPRYLIAWSIPVYLLVAWGSVEMLLFSAGRSARAVRLIGATILTGTLAVFVWAIGMSWNVADLRDEYASVAEMLRVLRQPGDRIVLNNDSNAVVFDYYYPQHADLYLQQPMIRTQADAEYWLKPLLAQAEGVWLVQNQFGASTDYNEWIRQALESRSLATRYALFPDAKVWFFALSKERARPERMDHIVHLPDRLISTPAAITDQAELLGLTQALPVLKAGIQVEFGLLWRTTDRLGGAWPVALSVQDASGAMVASSPVTLSAEGAGDYFVPVRVFIPPNLSSDRVRIGLVVGESITPLATFSVMPASQPESIASVPATATPLDITYEGGIHLRAVEWQNRAGWQPGQTLALSLIWQASAPIPENYKVFVHITGDQVNPASGNPIWGQHDDIPVGGSVSTTRWWPDSLMADLQTLTTSGDMPAGRYAIHVGLYPVLNGPRLAATDGQGHALGDYITVLEFDVVR